MDRRIIFPLVGFSIAYLLDLIFTTYVMLFRPGGWVDIADLLFTRVLGIQGYLVLRILIFFALIIPAYLWYDETNTGRWIRRTVLVLTIYYSGVLVYNALGYYVCVINNVRCSIFA
jgi:hypothetical protein